jgi:hypothetical protein
LFRIASCNSLTDHHRLRSSAPRAVQLITFQIGRSGVVFHQAINLFWQATNLFLAWKASRVAALHIQHPMTKSDAECEKEGPMTRKLLMTLAIVALTLTPSIGIGTVQAHGFGGRGFHGGGGFHGGFGRDGRLLGPGFYGFGFAPYYGYGGYYSPGCYGYGYAPNGCYGGYGY